MNTFWKNKGCGPFLFCPGIRINQGLSEFIRINHSLSEFERIKIRPMPGASVYLPVWAAYLPRMASLWPYAWEFTTWTGKRLYGPPGAFLDMISERRQTGNVKTVWISCLFAPYGVFVAVCGGIYRLNRKNAFTGFLARCARQFRRPL